MASRLNPPPNSLVDTEFGNQLHNMIFNYAVYGLPSGVMKRLVKYLIITTFGICPTTLLIGI